VSRVGEVAAADRESVLSAVEALIAGHPYGVSDRRALLEAQFDRGLAWIHFPPGRGGLGLDRSLQALVSSKLAAAGWSARRPQDSLGASMAAPTIQQWGSEEQATRHLRAIFTDSEVWCQLFSEPGAGSDLAGLATRAVRDGDDWVVNGQKVWSSRAHYADFGMLLVRTDPGLPKHTGMTYFILDMRCTGVEIRPLRQMTGEAEFNEVYLTEVRIPDAQRLGPANGGWRVALTTLMNERVMFGSEGVEAGPADIAVELFQRRARSFDSAMRARVVDLWIRSRVQRLNNARAAMSLSAGTPGPEGSIGKLLYADVNQLGYELCMDLLGDEAMLLFEPYDVGRHDRVSARESGDIRRRFLRSRAFSIEGGSTEIMRNIVGERVLGLPSEPRIDKDLPWSDVPRN
jgi:alkylation response protein AidB-like acyl-CoA dehydrogenase